MTRDRQLYYHDEPFHGGEMADMALQQGLEEMIDSW